MLPGVLVDCALVLDITGDSEELEVDRASGTGVTEVEVEHRGSSLGLVMGVTGDANNIPFSCAPPWAAESGVATCAFAF